MIAYLLAMGAGVATAASPCILPMLPLLLGASSTPQDTCPSMLSRHRPAFIVLGFVMAFSLAAWLFGRSTQVWGLSQEGLRLGAMAVMLGAGVLLLWPALLERVMAPLGGLADVAHRWGARTGTGPVGGVLLGMSLGLLWTPCAGPVLASALALIATETRLDEAAGLLWAYAMGAGLPMLAIGYGGQAITRHARALSRHAGRIRQVFGAMVLATVTAMFFGVDASAAAWLSRAASPSAAPVAPGMAGQGPSKPMAPEFAGIEHWFNAPPVNMAQLRGKVVLIDFWTFDCVNCINTLPHVQRWHERYKDQGLVVIGVHTPEFAFERDAKAVSAAIQRFGIGYAVAQDNAYRTWTAWGNAYWPSLYLVDRQGHVVFHHAGEGDYAHIEQVIRETLQAPEGARTQRDGAMIKKPAG